MAGSRFFEIDSVSDRFQFTFGFGFNEIEGLKFFILFSF